MFLGESRACSPCLMTLKSAIWQCYGEDIVTIHREIAFEQKKEGENREIKDEPLF